MEQIDVNRLIGNIAQFKNYWELYCFARGVFDKQEEFNKAMSILREEYLSLLPPLVHHH